MNQSLREAAGWLWPPVLSRGALQGCSPGVMLRYLLGTYSSLHIASSLAGSHFQGARGEVPADGNHRTRRPEGRAWAS